MDEQQALTPEQEDSAAALARELAEYKARERARALGDDARAGLRARGLSEGFAAFLIGADERETAKNLAEFEKCWQAAVGDEVRRRIPQTAPPDYDAVPPAPRKRGIRKV